MIALAGFVIIAVIYAVVAGSLLDGWKQAHPVVLSGIADYDHRGAGHYATSLAIGGGVLALVYISVAMLVIRRLRAVHP